MARQPLDSEEWERKLKNKTLLEDGAETTLAADEVIKVWYSYTMLSNRIHISSRYSRLANCLQVTEFYLREQSKPEITDLTD